MEKLKNALYLIMTRSILGLGYVVTLLGACLLVASYIGTYMRGGVSAVFERFFNPFSDVFLAVLCLLPGLLLLSWAWGRDERTQTDQ
jgi:hypothetical protein